jgi:hypothetical protein
MVSAPGELVAFDDPMCVADKSDVWISYGLTKDGTATATMNSPLLYALRLAHSGDGGQTIDTRIDAHDTAAGSFFQHPELAREPGGALDLTYYAGKTDMDMAGSFRRSRAAVPAMGFGPSVSVDAPLDFLTSRGDPRWLGDYTGIFARSGKLYLSYTVNDTAVSHVAFSKVKVP